MSLGQTIKKMRLDKGLSQKKLGDMCIPKIDASNIRRIENDTVSPTTETLTRIATALGVSVTAFFPTDNDVLSYKLTEALKDPEANNYKMLVSSLFEYVCGKNGFLVVSEEALGWSDCFRILGDNDIEFVIRRDDVNISFDRLIQHLSIELPAFLEEYKIENGK